MNHPPILLSWRDPDTRELRTMVEQLPITIGRAEHNTVVLTSRMISAEHARLHSHTNQTILTDLGSHNGVGLNGKQLKQAAQLTVGDVFQIGPYQFKLGTPTPKYTTPSHSEDQPESNSLTSVLAPPHSAESLTFPPAAFAAQVVPIATLEQAGTVESTTYLAVGGGLGSFAWVNHLRNYGASVNDIVSIGFEPNPYGRYKQLCQNSQIPNDERLRSNSDSCPDNMWGWPGYAVREIWSDVKRGQLGNAAQVGWQIFNEPFVQTYTPRAGAVFASIDHEAARIGWASMWRQGRVRAIRKTDDGRYAVAYSQLNSDGTTHHRLILARYLHLAVGYPGVRFLPELQRYREATGDFVGVVNAYEDHDHVYERFGRNGGAIVIRGRGIVASRIIQRIAELRQQTRAAINIVHLMRSPNTEGQQYRHAQRKVGNHWEFQPFNWPKAAWGGSLRAQLENADTQARAQLLSAWGGTTTADRKDWRDIIEQGLREGWYTIHFGTVTDVASTDDNRIASHITIHGSVAHQLTITADAIIDATGLESSIKRNALLNDLVTHYHLPRNGLEQLKVTNAFEIKGMRNGSGRVFAAGISTLGGPFAAVDSFLGLQYAALKSADSLTELNAPNLRRLNGLSSFMQWTRWARGVQP